MKNVQDLLRKISNKTDSKILLIVLDGLGGIPRSGTGKSELDTARTPNMDALAKISRCGQIIPVDLGITPGSGPAHLALFGYDPLEYDIGRGVLEALGIGIKLGCTDLACRANFASIDKDKGVISDRRAGRISTEKNVQLCSLLQDNIRDIDGAEIIIRPGKGHRFVVVFRGEGLMANISENDPQKEGLRPLPIEPLDEGSRTASDIINKFLKLAAQVIERNSDTFLPASYILMRGFSMYPDIPSMGEIYKLTPAAIATYPMYRGLAGLVGMQVLPSGETIDDEIDVLKTNYSNFDFFYLHIKETDAYGEDGNFDKKVSSLEKIDTYIPKIMELKPDVVVLTGDHSTPAVMKGHSWHPVPVIIHSRITSYDGVERFTERDCLRGSLGIFPSNRIMSLALANALKLSKYGA